RRLRSTPSPGSSYWLNWRDGDPCLQSVWPTNAPLRHRRRAVTRSLCFLPLLHSRAAKPKHRDHWFWVDDRDFKSKRCFSFLMMPLHSANQEEGPAADPEDPGELVNRATSNIEQMK